MPRPKRRPGGQPGNRNAVTHGFYAKGMTDAQALELDEAQRLPTDDLSGEMGRLRLHLRDLIGNSPDRAELVYLGLRTLASLARTQYRLKGSDADRLVDAMRAVLSSIEETLATPNEPDA